MKHDDCITHIKNEEDLDYLTRKLHDVNMRLFKTSKRYMGIVWGCCDYIEDLAASEREGYKKPHGMSGANVAIPFNIIGVVKNRGKKNEWVQIMINPRIVDKSEEMVEALSNCGSLTLPEPIMVKRHKWVKVQYYDHHGRFFEETYDRADGALTIQHEVDHNQGILITDRT
jgi:peptide deformylase